MSLCKCVLCKKRNIEVNYGYCHCLCGKKTTVYSKKPSTWIFNHHRKIMIAYKKKDMGFILHGKISLCWIWQGPISKSDSYPYATKDLRDETGESLAHRAYYRKYKKPIKNKNEIDHKCNIRVCVRPKHLQQVTAQRNAQLRNIRNPYAAARKLSDGEVNCARKMHNQGFSCRDIAEKLSIDESGISRLVRGVTYKFVSEERAS